MLRNAEFKQPETVRARVWQALVCSSWVSKPEKLGPQLVEKSPRTAEFKQPDCRLSQEGQGGKLSYRSHYANARGNTTEPDHSHLLASHCRRPEIGLFCLPDSAWFVLTSICQRLTPRVNWLCFVLFYHRCPPFGFTEDSSLSSRLSRLRLPPSPTGSGFRLYATRPRWLLLATDRRMGQVRTGPDLDQRRLYFNMSPNQTIPADKSTYSSPLAAAQPLIILSWPEALDASGSSRASRMAICCNAFPILVPLPCPLMNKRLATAGSEEGPGFQHDWMGEMACFLSNLNNAEGVFRPWVMYQVSG